MSYSSQFLSTPIFSGIQEAFSGFKSEEETDFPTPVPNSLYRITACEPEIVGLLIEQRSGQ
ncbi:MAG: hypothetical protein EBQ92_07735 [Proteobacteria bacterium]|nr:hypothetical protein [Pseudomonadota bacterium]